MSRIAVFVALFLFVVFADRLVELFARVECVEAVVKNARVVVNEALDIAELVGLDRFAGDGSCLYSARTASDVILYGVDGAAFEAAAARYPSIVSTAITATPMKPA